MRRASDDADHSGPPPPQDGDCEHGNADSGGEHCTSTCDDDGSACVHAAPPPRAEADGDFSLHAACRAGDLDAVEAMLAQATSRDLNSCDGDGRTPLFHAASRGRTAVVTALLAQGERIVADLPSPLTGATALVGAAGSGHTHVVELLLADGRADPRAVGFRNRGALHGAALYGHAAVAKLLVDDVRLGLPGIRAEDETGRTPLLNAAAKGHVAVLRVFVEAARRSDGDGGGDAMGARVQCGDTGSLFDSAAAVAEEAGHDKAAGLLRAAAHEFKLGSHA
jgi:ankyrin repeat protein